MPANPRPPFGQAIRRVGIREPWLRDLYHRMVTIRWRSFAAISVIGYLLVNAIFAGLFMLQPNSISGARPGSAWDAFFFSVQTIATIGYGVMAPATFYANLLVLVETVVGLFLLALGTGVLFARASRPTARVLFSSVVTIAPWNGVPTLSIRMGNERRSQILEADVAVHLLRFERSPEGVVMRRFHTLPLERSHTPLFNLSYTALHRILPGSPLDGATAESLEAEGVDLLVTVTGTEEATGQVVHARQSYPAAAILFERRYRDIFVQDARGERLLDYRFFDQTEAT